jgi:energy-coupling factor transport system permease protein
MEAQTARGIAFDQARGLKKLGMMLPLCVPLLISSVRRTYQPAAAAEIRGFSLRSSASAFRRYPFHLEDALVLGFCVLLIAASILL